MRRKTVEIPRPMASARLDGVLKVKRTVLILCVVALLSKVQKGCQVRCVIQQVGGRAGARPGQLLLGM